MLHYRADGVVDPLQDKLSLDDIAWVAPCMADEIRDLGAANVRRAACDRGIDPDSLQPMPIWASVIAFARQRRLAEISAA